MNGSIHLKERNAMNVFRGIKNALAISLVLWALIGLAVVAVAEAHPADYLTHREAKVEVRHYLQDPEYFMWGLEPGSLVTYGVRLAHNRIRVGASWYDWDLDEWGGTYRVRETPRSYYTTEIRAECLSCSETIEPY